MERVEELLAFMRPALRRAGVPEDRLNASRDNIQWLHQHREALQDSAVEVADLSEQIHRVWIAMQVERMMP